MAERTERDYQLGADVSAQARATKSTSVVLSIRLSASELHHLERLSQSQGKTISQVARDAISSYHGPVAQVGPYAMVGIAYTGTSVSIGSSDVVTCATLAEFATP